MNERAFDLSSFYADVGASNKERNALRQDLVRGLKDYFEIVYGYDRYGAETIFHLSERMSQPRIYGYAVVRILHDRRISESTKVESAQRALTVIEYGADAGLPFGLYAALLFLAQHDRLSAEDLRYALIVSAGEYNPFVGLEKAEFLDFMHRLLGNNTLPLPERMMWAHSLIARHQEQTGIVEMINMIMNWEEFAVEDRKELARAWINFRQPRLMVDIPERTGSARGDFVVDHMGFWVAHVPSWPNTAMVRNGLVWLVRLGEDPVQIAQTYIGYNDTYAEQVHAAVVDIISEHRQHIPESVLRTLIDTGVTISGSSPTRRKFYRLGSDIFGPQYLVRASADTANSVRQWAVRQMHKQG